MLSVEQQPSRLEYGARYMSVCGSLVIMQGTVFAVIGFVAGIAGTSISNGLIALRKNLDPNFKVVVSPHLLMQSAWMLRVRCTG
jgi:hypothetical protein